ncbi:MAG TPA: DUF2336 domain-containing protein [Xanthobacteraceae bacterium]|nr:DUF2336 domain-containing protein [Xanthobacteraceae bacterium]
MSAMFPSLEGLDSLARRDGVDIRPTLVRVLTDLYVQKPAHSAEEERHYTELMLRLIDAVDHGTRAAVARKIARYPGAPPAVARRLARDAIEVAEPILRYCEVLTAIELEAIIRDFGWSHAAIIAARREAPKAAPTSRPTTQSAKPPQPPRDPADLGIADLFFSADPAARRMLLLSLGDAEAEPPQSVQPVETIRALEAAALGRDRAGFIRLIEGALSLSQTQAERLVGDPSGEPLLIAAKALAMPSVVLQRILMFIDPAIGESVQRVFDLAGLYERVSMDAAHKLIDSMRGREPAQPRKPAAHRPMHYDDEAARGRRGTSRRLGTSTETHAPARVEPGKTQRTM